MKDRTTFIIHSMIQASCLHFRNLIFFSLFILWATSTSAKVCFPDDFRYEIQHDAYLENYLQHPTDDTVFLIELSSKAIAHPLRTIHKLKNHRLYIDQEHKAKIPNLMVDQNGKKRFVSRYLYVYCKNDSLASSKALRYLRTRSWIDHAGPIVKGHGSTAFSNSFSLKRNRGFSADDIVLFLEKQQIKVNKQEIDQKDIFTANAPKSFGSKKMLLLKEKLEQSKMFEVVEITLLQHNKIPL